MVAYEYVGYFHANFTGCHTEHRATDIFLIVIRRLHGSRNSIVYVGLGGG